MIASTWTAAALALALGCSEPRPNVILVSLDNLRDDHVGAYGYPRDTTPNLDRLAAEGVVFENSYATAPHTVPSHTSLLTSLYPSVHTVFNHGRVLGPGVVTLPEAYRSDGYATAAFTQLIGETFRRGFDLAVRLESPHQRGQALGDVSEVKSWLTQQRDGPFFLFLHSYDVHKPYAPPAEYRERFAPDYDGPLREFVTNKDIEAINSGELEVDERDLQYIQDLYDAALARADHILGGIFDHVRDLEIWDHTILVIFSDHGEEFGEHGQQSRHSHSLYNELLRTPLIVRGPGVPRGSRIELPVSSVDIAPTLLGLSGIPAPELFMGRDLRPAMSGRGTRPRPVIAELIGKRTLIDGDYKYFSDGRLFNLREDPLEQVDIAAQYPDVTAKMKDDLAQWVALFEQKRPLIETSGPETLTREEKRRLKALGYLQ